MSESIYTWIKETPPPPEKPALYRSTYAPDIAPTASTLRSAAVKKSVGVIGREVKETVKPTAFLRAHEKTAPVVDPKVLPAKFDRAEPVRKPAVPKRTEAPLHGLSSSKDFIAANAVDAILAVPKRRVAAEPDWRHKPDYGQVPEYLERVKKEVEAEHEYIQSLLDQQQMEEEAASGSHMRELGADERRELIDALKRKWDEVNSAYQKITWRKISTSNSTFGEIRWKEQCEAQLTQIEKDIERLSVKAPIYVVDDGAAGADGSH